VVLDPRSSQVHRATRRAHSRVSRAWAAFALALLLVSAQLGSALHAIGHAAAAADRPHPAFSVDADDACALCALYAAGSNLIAGATPASHALPAQSEGVVVTHVAATPAPPHYYQSRAPPLLR
jgi:hypothetical protein